MLNILSSKKKKACVTNKIYDYKTTSFSAQSLTFNRIHRVMLMPCYHGTSGITIPHLAQLPRLFAHLDNDLVPFLDARYLFCSACK